jgi:predicted lactoylglutathione lyase
MTRQIFVNLPVKDLDKSVAFFTQLGFSFNPQFTNEQATCMIVAENIFVMLLVESFFSTFTRKEISDAKKTTEVIVSLSAQNKEQVDDMANKAVAAGGTAPGPDQDYGWMYLKNFEDLDGHIWEIAWIDPAGMPQQ